MINGILLVLLLILLGGLKFNFASIKGRVGEAYVNRILEKLNNEEYKTFHDVYVPNKDGGITQVDHIVTSPYGIFVIETKHYKGWIFGKEDQKYWTQVIYKRKEKLFNPIWQNFGHLSALKAYADIEENKIHSIIAFSNNSTLKFVDNFKKARVIQFHELLQVINGYSRPVFTNQQLQAVNSKIGKLLLVDRKEKINIKKDHIETIKRKKRVSTTGSNTGCPKCGGNLVMRKGKFGSFQGCSNYPKCRYTREVGL